VLPCTVLRWHLCNVLSLQLCTYAFLALHCRQLEVVVSLVDSVQFGSYQNSLDVDYIYYIFQQWVNGVPIKQPAVECVFCKVLHLPVDLWTLETGRASYIYPLLQI
jgi:hypothetical protein